MQNRGRSFPSGGPSGGKFDMGAAGGLSPIAQRVLASQANGQSHARPTPVTPPPRPLQLNARGSTTAAQVPARPTPTPARVPVNQNQNAGYVPNGVYGYRSTPQPTPQPSSTPPPTPVPPTLAQTGGVPPRVLPPTPTEPTDWGHGNLLLGTSDVPPSAPPSYSIAKQPHSHKLLVILVLVAVLAVGGLAAGLWWQQKNHVDSQLTVNQAFSQGLNTQTYTQTLAITKGNSTVRQTRQADFRKLDEPRIYVNNITTDPKQDQVEATVIGETYYAKKHVSAKELADASADQKPLLTQINNKWVTVIKSGKPVQDDATKALNLTVNLQKLPILVPSTVLVGDIHTDQRQQLVNQLVQNQPYTAANGQPTKEIIDGQQTWRFSLEVNKDKVTQLNTLAAKLLGTPDTKTVSDQLKNNIPENVALWVRRSDSRIVRYAYALQGITYDYQFSKIGQSIAITTPQAVTVAANGAVTPAAPPTTPATPPPSDDDIQQTIGDIMDALQSAVDSDTPPPANLSDFMTVINGAVSADELKKFDIQFSSGTPHPGQIFYYTGRKCADDGSFTVSSNPADYAIASPLSDSLYCKDQVN